MSTKTEQIARPLLFPAQVPFRYSESTMAEARKLNHGTVDEHAHQIGMQCAEPIIVMLDCLLKYAQVYKVRFEGPLADDQYLGEYWLDALKGVRKLLDGDGAVAMLRGVTTDSKSNGACESMFWKAMEAAGFTEKDL